MMPGTGRITTSFGAKEQLILTRLLHSSRGMHAALKKMGGPGSVSVGVGTPIECNVTREADPSEIAKAFGRVLSPGRGRMRKPESCPFYTRIEDPLTLAVEHRAIILEGLDPDRPETHPNGIEHEAVAYGSGMGAIFSAIMSATRHGDHIIILTPVYGCTFRLAKRLIDLGRTIGFVPVDDLAAIKKAVNEKTTVIYGEILSNPTLRFMDVAGAATIARTENLKVRKRPIRVIVDTTFGTPLGFRGFEHGADIVVCSDTKFRGGFAEYCAGTAVGPQEVVLDPAEDMGFLSSRHQFGSVLNPWEARQLTSQGYTTLFGRLRYYEAVAKVVAEALVNDKRIDKVVYPGLHTYPDRTLAETYLRDYDGERFNGSMLYVELKGAAPQEARERGFRLMKYLYWKGWATSIAVSLGAIYTLVEHPASMTHSALSVEELKASGISAGGVRFSFGQEDPNILIDEINAGLAFAYSDQALSALEG